MEKQKPVNSVASALLGGESNAFICTECGDGFTQYSDVLAHMAIHGPLESFSFDGSSNGFEVPREYVLQENGTLTVVHGSALSNSAANPISPGVLPSHLPLPFKPTTPTLRQPHSSFVDEFKPRLPDLTLDRSRRGHYRCEICSRSFTSLQSLHRHQQYRNTERGYKCTLCCKIFEGRQDLKKHLQHHANESFHCCGHCGKRFLKVDSLSAHQKEIHSTPNATTLGELKKKREKKFEKSYHCNKCKLNFFWISDFQTHLLYHCKGKEPDAAVFASEIENVEDKPLENCHSNGPSIDFVIGDDKLFGTIGGGAEAQLSFTPYRCGLCGDRFQMLAALKEHHLTHQTQEEIDRLNQELEQPVKWRMPSKGRHRRGSNPKAKRHPCKHCHRVFNHSSSLSRHMRYHKGTMHTCALCGRHFPQRCDLRRHLAMYHKPELEHKQGGLKLVFTATPKGPIPNPLISESHASPRKKKPKRHFDDEQNASPEPTTKGKQTGKSGRANYKCLECGKTFGLLCVYQRHLRYHKKEPCSSPQYPHQFNNSLSREPHLQLRPSTGQAHVFGETLHSRSRNRDPVLKNVHVREDLEDDFTGRTRNVRGRATEVLYECTECTETFLRLEAFLQHQTSHGLENNG